MNLMERFADPAFIGQMTTAERLAGAGVTAVMGIGVTFMVLILLWACIVAMGKLLTARLTAANSKETAAVPKDEELAAAIAAALCASVEGSRRMQIRMPAVKFKDISGDSWIQAGRWERMK